MKMIALKLLLIFSCSVISHQAEYDHEIDHIRHHHPPDTVPEADLSPLDRFQTTTTEKTHTLHHSYQNPFDYYNYDDDSSTYQDIICGRGEWQCKDGTCLQSNLRCNRMIECPDMSDEKDCDTTCEGDEWQCGNGECLDKSLRCNGITDCNDTTDEMDCGTEYDLYLSSGGDIRACSLITCIMVTLIVFLL